MKKPLVERLNDALRFAFKNEIKSKETLLSEGLSIKVLEILTLEIEQHKKLGDLYLEKLLTQESAVLELKGNCTVRIDLGNGHSRGKPLLFKSSGIKTSYDKSSGDFTVAKIGTIIFFDSKI